MPETSKKPRRAAKVQLPFSAKDRIDHSIFGLGTIVEIDERRTTIAFDESGTKKFVTSIVKLASSDVPAPLKKKRVTKKKVAKKAAKKA